MKIAYEEDGEMRERERERKKNQAKKLNGTFLAIQRYLSSLLPYW